jgi:hypothetical protein
VGQIRHVVEQGECLSSVAARYGFDWHTLWEDSANAELKKNRKDPNILFPGDVVVVPELKPRKENCASGALHQFVCKTTVEPLRIRFLDDLDQPVAQKNYELVVGGRHRTGTTNGDGELVEKLPPNTKVAQLFLGDERQEYQVLIGGLDPLTEISGVQARLANLGYDPGPSDGIAGPHTSQAIGAFQDDCGLDPTGKMNDDTVAALKDRHGR